MQRYDRPAELRRGVEDNLRGLAVGDLTVVNLRLMDGAPPGRYVDDQLAAMVAACVPRPARGAFAARPPTAGP